MSESEYKTIIQANPLLMRRPDLISHESENTRDFKFPLPAPVIENEISNLLEANNPIQVEQIEVELLEERKVPEKS